jgi:hypothetical protein
MHQVVAYSNVINMDELDLKKKTRRKWDGPDNIGSRLYSQYVRASQRSKVNSHSQLMK